MYFNPLQQANQYLYQGQQLLQQASVAQSSGNLQAAMQLSDAAIGNIIASMQIVWQSGALVSHFAYFVLAVAYFSSGTARMMLGWNMVAMTYYHQALQAITIAITSSNSQVAGYHTLAGMIFITQGNFMEAENACRRAIQIDPMESTANWMLALINQARGNQKQAQNFSNVANNANPALPAIPERFDLSSGHSQQNLRILVSDLVKEFMKDSKKPTLWNQPSQTDTSSALDVWKQKLEFLLQQEAMVDGVGKQFEIRKQIEEAQRRIQDLTG